MAMNPAMKAVLRAISYVQPDIKKRYPRYRMLGNILARLYTAPKEYRIWERRVLRDGYAIPVRIVSPPKPTDRALVFFHGGGWVTGSLDTYRRTCVDMCRQTGHMVIAVDYRLSPEVRFPTALEDCYEVLRVLYAGRFAGVLPENLTLVGDSAGGNLAAALSLLARDRGEFCPRRQILIYPATDNQHGEDSPYPSVGENGRGYLLTTQRMRDYLALYRSCEEDISSCYLAPILAEDLSRQPDTLMITAEFCLLRDEGEAYARRLKESGNRVEVCRVQGALHGFFTLPSGFSQVGQLYDAVNGFLRRDDSHEQ